MTERDKKLLPFLIVGLLGCVGALYWVYTTQISPPPPVQNTVQPVSTPSLGASAPELQAHNASLTSDQFVAPASIEQYEYTDMDGNIVQEIIQHEPLTIDSSNYLLVSDDNKKIIDLMRNNFLLEVQAKNQELKIQKNMISDGGMEVAPTNMNVAYSNVPQVNTSSFTEIETTQPLLSSVSADDMEVEDQFGRITLASITVSNNNGIDEVSAWIRFDGKLFKVDVGKKLGDFEFMGVTPANVAIKYKPANITKVLGHTGFEG
jgi:hypothetical protein